MAARPGDGKEGVDAGLRRAGAAINLLYVRERQSIAHILARHVEGASHMAEGYSTRASNTSASAPSGGTDYGHWLRYSAPTAARSWCASAGASSGRMEDFQAVDIESISPLTKWSHIVREPAAPAPPAGLSPDAVWPARPGAGPARS
jgi:tartronate-semialdehyde synthase